MAHVVTAEIRSARLAGTIPAIASKSAAHRVLICAALADAPCEVRCSTTSRDIEATVGCLETLGARVERVGGGFLVTPIPRLPDGRVPEEYRMRVLDCDESGSTLRFMLPVSFALGAESVFVGRGRLPERPLSPLREQLEEHGCELTPAGEWPLCTGGRLTPGTFAFPGDVSSQFTTGLLLALPCVGGSSTVCLRPPVESRPYIVMTTDTLAQFGVHVSNSVDGRIYELAPEPLRSPGVVRVEDDWSNAAFWLAADALGARVSLTGLSMDSAQGDRAVCDILGRFGARTVVEGDALRVEPPAGALSACDIDAADVPDLVPVLAVVAACARGVTRVTNAGRLRIKESDRLASTTAMLRALGAQVEELPDGLVIHGLAQGDEDPGACLRGAVIPSFNDHRLAMAEAVAAVRCDGMLTVTDAQAVGKSYPGFFEDFRSLGGQVELDEGTASVEQ